jgi:hypothetical protein
LGADLVGVSSAFRLVLCHGRIKSGFNA